MEDSRTEAFKLRPATPDDVAAIATLIRELAAFEKLEHECKTDETRLREHLFGARPYIEAIVAEVDDAAVGFALFFHNYSTFLSRPGIYLEDLYVRPEHRRKGIGKALLNRVIEIARERDCDRVEWLVLDWNSRAIDFYKRLGAERVEGWSVYRITERT